MVTKTQAILYLILQTLREIKEQEKQYWETWKLSKDKEIEE